MRTVRQSDGQVCGRPRIMYHTQLSKVRTGSVVAPYADLKVDEFKDFVSCTQRRGQRYHLLGLRLLVIGLKRAYDGTPLEGPFVISSHG